MTDTYGVGPAAEKMNVGPAHSTDSVMEPGGVVKVDGKVVFDPEKHGLEVQLPDPDIDYEEAVGGTRETDVDSQPKAGKQDKKDK